MLEMYAPMVNSPITELANAIDAEQTTIEVVDGSKLPDGPNLAMIGLGENTETILYTQKDGNVLSGVTRGFQGIAKAWPQGTRVARFFAAYDQMAIQENIKTLDQSLAAHLNDFAQVWSNRIIEMGSNANGTYVRWENGLQICLHRFAGALEAQEIKAEDWIFPASFGPGIIYLICGGGPASDNIQLLEYGFNTQAAQNTNTKTRVVRRNTHTTNPDTSSLYVMAVGRWK